MLSTRHEPELDQAAHGRAPWLTLIEALVTIAIIAILAALLLPALCQGKALAKSVKCKSNLRQMSIALQLYVSDWSFYPPFGRSETNWVQLLAPHLGELSFRRDLLRCPGDKESKRATSYGYNYCGSKNWHLFGDSPEYGLGLGGRFDIQRSRDIPMPESGVRAPSQMIALADGFCSVRWRVVASSAWIGVNLVGGTTGPDEESSARRRHRGRLNVAFCDGHVEALRYRQLLLEPDEEMLRLWNNDNDPHSEFLMK